MHFNHVNVATYLKEYIEAHPVWREEGETCDEDDDEGEEEDADGEKDAEIPFQEVHSEGGGVSNETPTIVVNQDSGC